MKIRLLKCDPKHRNGVREFTKFAGRILFGPHLVRHIHTSISFREIKGVDGDDLDGQCTVSDDEKKPRHFLLHVDPTQNFEKILQTIGHELCHAKQFARGELIYFNKYITIWKNESYGEETSYYREPWEIEAFGEGLCLPQYFYEEYPEFKPKIDKKEVDHLGKL